MFARLTVARAKDRYVFFIIFSARRHLAYAERAI